jgi:hypothetical protein
LGGLLVVAASLAVASAPAFGAGDANHPNPGECSAAAEGSPGFSSLPDCRVYELVTPAQKNGALVGVFVVHGMNPKVSRDGQRVAAISVQCIGDPESCIASRGKEGEPYVFERTSGGWVTKPLTPPASFQTSTWLAVNPEAASVLFSTPQEPESLTDDFDARVENDSPVKLGPLAEHGIPGVTEETNYKVLSEGVVATADLSHVVYETTGPVFDEDKTGEGHSLYEYAGPGGVVPLLVGVTGGPGSTELVGVCGIKLGGGVNGAGAQQTYNSVSGDGRMVFFTVAACGNGTGANDLTPVPAFELYARIDGESPDARTVLVSAPTAAACTSVECLENTGLAKESERARDAQFEGASGDGSRVVFTDTQQLTDGANESEGSAVSGCSGAPGAGCNLYVSECPAGRRCETPGERVLLDASEGAKETSGPRVQGIVAISEDGSHIYFVAQGALTGGEENTSHETATEGAENLYVYSAGRVTFITQLAAADSEQWEQGTQIANATPNGDFLVFLSHHALTADDTREEGPRQVYEYDALTRSLVRVSKGAAGDYECPETKTIEAGFDCNGNTGEGNAKIVEADDGTEAATVPIRTSQSVSDDGSFVFFQSPIALTPGALNDVVVGPNSEFVRNVYEYHEGQVFLISDGADATPGSRLRAPVELVGADASGANVFFSTFDQLTPEDTDTQRDYYDAHICSSAEPCRTPATQAPPCGEGSCQPPPTPGGGAAEIPASASFTGPGDLLAPTPTPTPAPKPKPLSRAQLLAKALRACSTKHSKHARTTCQARARKRYAPARKAGHARHPG